MENKNIHQHAGWYASYDRAEQGRALILCQEKKIKQLLDIIEKIKMDVDLTLSPRLESDDMVISSISYLVNNIPEIEHKEGYFKWIG